MLPRRVLLPAIASLVLSGTPVFADNACEAKFEPLAALRFVDGSRGKRLDETFFKQSTVITGAGPALDGKTFGNTRDPLALTRVQAAWKEVLSPDMKAPADAYQYLVHSARMGSSMDFRDALKSIDKTPYVSSSLIFPGHTETFKVPYALVLRAKPETVVASAPTDMFGFFNTSGAAPKAEDVFKKHGLETPASLMTRSKFTGEGFYNEVVLKPEKPGDVEVVGVVVVVDKDGKADGVDSYTLGMLEREAKSAGLPFRKIEGDGFKFEGF